MELKKINIDELFQLHWSDKIQLDKSLALEIASKAYGKRMLVFGLGLDSPFWFHLTGGNTYFIEDNDEYIFLNQQFKNNIIPYSYEGTSVSRSLRYLESPNLLYSLAPPSASLRHAPYDVILIDGPPGYALELPGRMHPIKWAPHLVAPNGTIYIDDADRDLESLAIKRYLPGSIITQSSRGNQYAKYENSNYHSIYA